MLFQFDESLIPLLEYKVSGELPNLFTMEDGTPLTCREQWEQRRREMYKTAVEIQYGTMPPEPEFLEVEQLGTSLTSLPETLLERSVQTFILCRSQNQSQSQSQLQHLLQKM